MVRKFWGLLENEKELFMTVIEEKNELSIFKIMKSASNTKESPFSENVIIYLG